MNDDDWATMNDDDWAAAVAAERALLGMKPRRTTRPVAAVVAPRTVTPIDSLVARRDDTKAAVSAGRAAWHDAAGDAAGTVWQQSNRFPLAGEHLDWSQPRTRPSSGHCADCGRTVLVMVSAVGLCGRCENDKLSAVFDNGDDDRPSIGREAMADLVARNAAVMARNAAVITTTRRPAAATAPRKTPTVHDTLERGATVIAHDKGNYGVVMSVDWANNVATVNFRNNEESTSATVKLPIGLLEVVR